MIRAIVEFVFGSKLKTLKNKIDKKYFEAVNCQRNGDIREYSRIMEEISKLESEYEKLQNS